MTTERSPEASPHTTANHRARPNPAIVVVPILLVLVTFLFWYQTWFGGRLSNREMEEYLTDVSVPHKTQHALAQMGDRMSLGDESVKQWYPRVVALTKSPQPQFRLAAAWVMGQDSNSALFHQALRALLQDGEPVVRLNAALALVRFRDPAGEPELRHMLRAYILRTPRAGKVEFLMKKGDTVRTSSTVARIKTASGEIANINAPLAGEIQELMVPDKSAVEHDGALMVLSPGVEEVWECLRGLCLVGEAQDVEEIETLLRNRPQLPERLKQQAQLTIEAIRSRATVPRTQSGRQGPPGLTAE